MGKHRNSDPVFTCSRQSIFQAACLSRIGLFLPLVLVVSSGARKRRLCFPPSQIQVLHYSIVPQPHRKEGPFRVVNAVTFFSF